MPASTHSAVLQPYGIFDIAAGAAVIIVALAFLAFMEFRTGTGRLGSYTISVELADAGGLKVGSDVRLHGIKIGAVSDLSLGPSQTFAIVRIAVRDDLKLPVGSAFFVTNWPMSDSYLAITPGRGASSIPQGSLVRRPAPPGERSPGV